MGWVEEYESEFGIGTGKGKESKSREKPIVPQVVEPPGEMSGRKVAYEEMERDSVFFSLLTDVEKEAYAGWFDVMVNGKSKMSPEDAHLESAKRLTKSSAILQARVNEEKYKRLGYLEILSSRFGKKIYIVRTESDKISLKQKVENSAVLDEDIYLESEIQELAGLRGDELTLMLEARKMFKGEIIDPKKSRTEN